VAFLIEAMLTIYKQTVYDEKVNLPKIRL